MKHKFRAECQYDVELIRIELRQLTSDWKTVKTDEAFPDVEVEFSTRKDTITLEQIKSIISSIDDCHVPAETIQLIENYTGIRS